jgi:ribose transport system ATP-binding protein
LVQAVAGIVAGLPGTVEVAGSGGTKRIRSQADAAAAGVAYVSGDRKREGIFPNMSVLDNFGMTMYRTTRSGPLIDVRSVRAEMAAESGRLSLRSPGERASIGALSGGNQQKVLIARALSARPSVLVLNDPTRGVDIRTKRDIYQLLRELSRQGVSILFFSTEIEEFAEACHRVAVMRLGTLFATLEEAEMSADRILGALFGQSERSGVAAPQGDGSQCQA